MIDGCLTITKSYLNMLKKNDVYDNSVIIIMSDHGEGLRSNDFQRQNPILFVKGINEKHNKMITSQKPVHFSDLGDLYKDLLHDKKSTEVFNIIPNKRTRTFLYYTFADKDSMIEYEATGKVLDKKNIRKTGNEYSIKR